MASSSSPSSSNADRGPPNRRHSRKLGHMSKKKTFRNMTRLARDLSSDDETFERSFGINKTQFKTLRIMLMGQINRSLSKFQSMKQIRGKDRLALCLRFLASGKRFTDLGVLYNVQGGVIETIVREVCNIILQQLRPIVLPPPTRQMWEKIAMGFKTLHDMPNCLGSINGRYINVQNQKLCTLLALVDANYKFVMIDIGDYDLNPQSIWDVSLMARRFKDNQLDVPAYEPVDGYLEPPPYVVVGGSSYPSKPFLITEHKDADVDKAFSTRVKPLKQTAEEAMARLRRRWRIIQCAFPVPSAVVERIILAVCCLDNYFSSSPI